MKARILLVVFVAAVLVLLVARLVRPTPPTAPNNPPTNTVAESLNSGFQADPGGAETNTPPRPRLPHRPNVPNARGNWASEPLPSGSNLQAQLEELAQGRGVPLSVLTQQLAMELSNAFFQALSGPVDFYGKAVDEGGTPLVGATATIRCLLFPEKQITTNAPTDANGDFALHGMQAQAISVFVAKDGYEEVPGTNEHHFGYYGLPKSFQPDPNNPIIFHLRRKE
jgi:hypothetical protein